MTIVNSPTHATSPPSTVAPWPSSRRPPPPWSSSKSVLLSNHDNVIFLSASASAVTVSILRKSTRKSNSFRVRDDLFFQQSSFIPECEFLEYTKQATTTTTTTTSSLAAIESVVSSLLVLLRSLVVIPDGCAAAATNGLLLLASNKVTTMMTATTMTQKLASNTFGWPKRRKGVHDPLGEMPPEENHWRRWKTR